MVVSIAPAVALIGLAAVWLLMVGSVVAVAAAPILARTWRIKMPKMVLCRFKVRLSHLNCLPDLKHSILPS